MLRRFLSWILVAVAVLFLLASLLALTIDKRVLNAPLLSKTLKDSGSYAEMAKAIPELATKKDKNDNSNQQQDPAETAKIKSTLAKVIDEAYISSKTDAVISSFIGYIKTGIGSPKIDLSDIPAKIAATGVEVPKDIVKNTKDPIDLTDKNKDAFAKLRKGYSILRLATILGPVIFVLLLLIEWFITDKWHRYGRIGRVFVAASMWSFLLWLGVWTATTFAYKSAVQDPDKAELFGLIKSITSGVNTLLGDTFMIFGLVSLSLGVGFYLLHFKFERKPKEPGATMPPNTPTNSK